MRSAWLWVGLLGCSGAAMPPSPLPPPVAQQRDKIPPLVGIVTREQVLATFPAWQRAFETSAPDPEAARQLTSVPEGARVDVYFGTWCSDSRHELPRLWKAMDLAGTVPFEVRWIAVDRQKKSPEVVDALDLKRVPTFVVIRHETETGRIVEHAPNGIETELRALLAKP